jgi:hypothetical protein
MTTAAAMFGHCHCLRDLQGFLAPPLREEVVSMRIPV